MNSEILDEETVIKLQIPFKFENPQNSLDLNSIYNVNFTFFSKKKKKLLRICLKMRKKLK